MFNKVSPLFSLLVLPASSRNIAKVARGVKKVWQHCSSYHWCVLPAMNFFI